MREPSELLLEAARRGELHHSVILHGGDPDALFTLAIRIAKALVCERGSAGDDCAACSKVAKEIHPDVKLVVPNAERKMIAVEQIREIVAESAMRPYEARQKVFIVAPVDSISVSGANAMLKTLEEPPAPSTFLLLTKSADLLLPTIRSRSQAVEIRARSSRSGSSFEAALPSRDDVGAIARDHAKNLARAAAGEGAALLKIASDVGRDDDANGAIAILALTLREVAGRSGHFFDETTTAAIRGAFGADALLDAANEVLEILPRLVTNVDVRLLVESALAALPARK